MNIYKSYNKEHTLFNTSNSYNDTLNIKIYAEFEIIQEQQRWQKSRKEEKIRGGEEYSSIRISDIMIWNI